MSTSKSPTTSNDYQAEADAQTAPAAAAPLPLIAMDLTDPNALENLRIRAAKAKAARGRSSLIITLPTASAAPQSGLSIPR